MRGRRWLGVGLGLAVLVGACGGDDDDQTSGANDGAGDTASVPADTASVPADAAGAFGFTSSECRDIALAIASGSASAFTGSGVDGFDEARETLERFADAAPSEIAGDVRLLARYMEDLAGVLADAGFDLSDPQALLQPENLQKLQGLESRFEDLDSDEVQAASERIDAYLKDRCGAG